MLPQSWKDDVCFVFFFRGMRGIPEKEMAAGGPLGLVFGPCLWATKAAAVACG